MNGALEIPLLRLAAGYVFVAIVLAIAARWKVGRTWEIVLATFRMTVQLVAVGYLLELVFVRPNPWITLAIFLVMEAFAVRNVFARVRVPTPARLRTTIIGSLAFGSSPTTTRPRSGPATQRAPSTTRSASSSATCTSMYTRTTTFSSRGCVPSRVIVFRAGYPVRLRGIGNGEPSSTRASGALSAARRNLRQDAS